MRAEAERDGAGDRASDRTLLVTVRSRARARHVPAAAATGRRARRRPSGCASPARPRRPAGRCPATPGFLPRRPHGPAPPAAATTQTLPSSANAISDLSGEITGVDVLPVRHRLTARCQPRYVAALELEQPDVRRVAVLDERHQAAVGRDRRRTRTLSRPDGLEPPVRRQRAPPPLGSGHTAVLLGADPQRLGLHAPLPAPVSMPSSAASTSPPIVARS